MYTDTQIANEIVNAKDNFQALVTSIVVKEQCGEDTRLDYLRSRVLSACIKSLEEYNTYSDDQKTVIVNRMINYNELKLKC
jgi:S-adenosylmethionine synthetase